MQLLLCLYPGAEAGCPQHTHATRKLTLSLGHQQTLMVDRRQHLMGHGDVVELTSTFSGDVVETGWSPRISVNFFFALQSDLQEGPVSVNSNFDGAYARLPKGPRACFMDEKQAHECVLKLREKVGRGWKHSPWRSGGA